MEKKTLGLFGDSYIAFPIGRENWSQRLAEHYDVKAWGKYGSSLFYAIDKWQTGLEQLGGKDFDYAIFTLTWHMRLFSVNKDRNDYFCYPHPDTWERGFQDPEIQTQEDFEKFKFMVKNYHQYIFDDRLARFHHELEIKYILDLPLQYPNTRFIFIPNTNVSRDMARKHHHHGVLMDFAFEDVSNQESDCPGQMPIVRDHRTGHISDANHNVMYRMMSETLRNYEKYQDQIVPVDMGKFHLDNKSTNV